MLYSLNQNDRLVITKHVDLCCVEGGLVKWQSDLSYVPQAPDCSTFQLPDRLPEFKSAEGNFSPSTSSRLLAVFISARDYCVCRDAGG